MLDSVQPSEQASRQSRLQHHSEVLLEDQYTFSSHIPGMLSKKYRI